MGEKEIATQSKQRIVRSLFTLMEKDLYESLSISEIAAEAGLDRRTFYRHFKKKDDIISYYLKSCATEYEHTLRSNSVIDNKTIAEAFFAVCSSQKSEFLLLFKQGLSHLVLSEIGKIFTIFQKRFASKAELEHPKREYLLAYHIGGFWNIMNQWLSNGGKEAPSEMANLIVQMEMNQI